jgi:hypothetical protein
VAYADTPWKLITNGEIIIGVTELTFEQFGGAASGANTNIQFNNNGAFAGSANLTWNGSELYANGSANITGNVTGNYFIGNGSQLTGISSGGVLVGTVDDFTGDGSTVDFTLSVTPTSENVTSVNITGVSQLKTAYSITGNVITFSSAPAAGAAIEVTTLSGSIVSVGNIQNGTSNVVIPVANGNVTIGVAGTGNVAVISSTGVTVAGNLISTGAVYSNYNTDTANVGSFMATGGNTKGGTGYLDFLVAQNTSGGATNPYKWLRLNSSGGLEIINSAYNNLLLSLTDAGALSIASSISVAGKKAVNGPAFRAYIDAGQTITSGSQQKVTFGTETFDTDGNFASSRFTPTTEGYYQLNSTVRIAGGSSTGEYMLVIWKNGSEYARGNNGSGTEIGASFYSLQVSDIAYANGTGDYFEIYIQQTSGGNKDTTAGAQISYFSGVMVRGA